ncbi:hypothetical protein [Acaryochloris sp. CCMEE 5410]|uniref:hypothetical protein n=1 Tax=Acaryochloris sp. CCMEE 5410 TaxID=310037 RepID=UPI0002483990|nr:hypothetical protein [Acaryochloris sp. CCMEE 5410]KAI9135117.1 hypothetical protein ON05_018960 [Acaryochloris sp. CCMEE 5410]
MGKKKINSLLKRLKENHQKDIENSAYIYSVAQGAVNQIDTVAHKQKSGITPSCKLLPSIIDKEELVRRYKNYNGCRKAAKTLGIKFKKTPSWNKLICAFSYAEIFKEICRDYSNNNPDPLLSGITIEIQF